MNIHVDEDHYYICKNPECNPIILESAYRGGYYQSTELIQKSNNCIRFPDVSPDICKKEFYLLICIDCEAGHTGYYNSYSIYESLDEIIRDFKDKFMNEKDFKEFMDTFHFQGELKYSILDLTIKLIGHVDKPVLLQ